MGVGWGLHVDVDSSVFRPAMEVTASDGNALLTVPQKTVDVFVGGRRFGYKTNYNRITANVNEFTPAVERSYWVRAIDSEENRVTFELQSVPPLDISVRDEDGSPVADAELTIFQAWSSYRMPLALRTRGATHLFRFDPLCLMMSKSWQRRQPVCKEVKL